MAKIAETLVEDWLNRQGYFTMRGMRKGRNEADLLAYRPTDGSALHVEVNVNTSPMGPLGPALDSAPETEKDRSTEEFVSRKYHNENIEGLREQIVPNANWRFMLVYAKLNYADRQISILKRLKVEPKDLSEILAELAGRKDGLPFKTESDAEHLAKIAEIYRTN